MCGGFCVFYGRLTIFELSVKSVGAGPPTSGESCGYLLEFGVVTGLGLPHRWRSAVVGFWIFHFF